MHPSATELYKKIGGDKAAANVSRRYEGILNPQRLFRDHHECDKVQQNKRKTELLRNSIYSH